MIRFSSCALILCAVGQVAIAGRPIDTDDASVTAHKTCQLDFWTEAGRQSRQDNFNGGCNVLGSGEFSLAVGSVQGNDEDQSLGGVGYKHIFKDFTADSPGFGLAASREWGRLKSTNESSKETLLTSIATVPLAGEDLLLHLNLGYLRFTDQTQRDSSVYKAAALDYSLSEKTGLSVETFSGVGDSLIWRLGARYTLIPDFLQVDASYGSDYGSFQQARVFTIGLGITPGF